jgi:molybdopterin converting factor small subunit
MKIRFKLYAGLQQYLPEGAIANQVELDVPDGSTPGDLARQFNLPPKLTHLVLVNAHYLDPAVRDHYALVEGDVLAIWPPVAGG